MAPLKGFIPWNKGLTGKAYLKHYPNGIKTNKFPKGNQYAKGKHPKHAFKKGNKPWNYIDGRSKIKIEYGSDWKKIRTRILIREDYQCQKCGIHKSKVKFMDVHHIKPFLKSFDNSEKNLMLLCRKCHIKEEQSKSSFIAGEIRVTGRID